MPLISRLIGGLRGLLRRTRVEQELDDELRQFFEAAVEEKTRAGLTREDAIRAARIVGVVKDVRERGHELAMKPAAYFPVAQRPEWSLDNLIVRVRDDPASVVDPIRRIVASIDPAQAVAGVRTMNELIDLDIADRRQQMALLGVFAGLALLLASIGLYGVLSYAVTQRSRELGLRLALGASGGSVMRMVVARGAWLTAAGLAIGLALAWVLTRSLQSLLYGVTANDPATFGIVVALFGTIALIACAIPARHATRLDPLVALRGE